MKEGNFLFDRKKNAKLKVERGVSFEDVIYCINEEHVLDILPHPNQKEYPRQMVLVVNINNYAYQVPFEIRDEGIWLVTVFPSRKATKIYLECKDGQ